MPSTRRRVFGVHSYPQPRCRRRVPDGHGVRSSRSRGRCTSPNRGAGTSCRCRTTVAPCASTRRMAPSTRLARASAKSLGSRPTLRTMLTAFGSIRHAPSTVCSLSTPVAGFDHAEHSTRRTGAVIERPSLDLCRRVYGALARRQSREYPRLIPSRTGSRFRCVGSSRNSVVSRALIVAATVARGTADSVDA